jgi:cytochrome oxidase Cu insertion factor (SCO1/SenC/PrrC family)
MLNLVALACNIVYCKAIVYCKVTAMSDKLPQARTKFLTLTMLCVALAFGVASFSYKPTVTSGSGTALVGGPFTMVSQAGEEVTEKTFAGRYMLMFFGFTSCPDVCPTELQVMSEALNLLGPEANKITPVFVTLDPARDTPDVVKAYVANFDPRLVGLTGTQQQVADIAKAYRVYYQKVENPKNPDGYTMDHTSIIYLMGPAGDFRKHFSYETDAQKLAAGIKQILDIQ